MSLFDKLGGQNAQQQDPQQALQQLKAKPKETLHQRGFEIPDGMTDAQQMVNYLIQSGQVPQSRLTRIMNMVGGRR